MGPESGFYGRGVLTLAPYNQASLYSPGVSYGTQVYRKGPYVFHMLRQILGPELFRTLLQRFLKNFAGRQPMTPDFSDAVKKVAGEYDMDWFHKNLDDWFEDWYIDPGHAKIRFSWSVQEDAEKKDGYVFTGRIKQEPDEFKMVLAPITLRFKKHPTSAQRFFVDEPDYEFQLRVPGEPTEVVFDELKTLAAEVTIEEE